ncbi:MAG: hypothetical protein ACOCWK_03790, partial [Tangfeifania sp.]
EKPAKLKWKIYVDSPGTKNLDVSYSYQQEKSNGNLSVTVNNKKLIHHIKPTGKTIGEPNSDWIIDNYKSHRIGQVTFPEKGYYDIELKINPSQNNELKFQWIWLK